MLPSVSMIDPLKAYRSINGMSQKAVADKLGVSRGMVGLLENGAREYTADMAIKIERALGIDRTKVRPDLFVRRAA